MYKLKITSNEEIPFIRCIVQGIKKAEGRIATDYVKGFKVGESLKLVSDNEFTVCKITYLNFYKSFEQMLKAEGYKNMVPFVDNFNDAVNLYKSFPGWQRVSNTGCCAIGIKNLHSDVVL